MRLTSLVLTAIIVLCAAAPARAQVVVVIPDNSTVQCNDGSWAATASQRGACSGHKGVKHWIGKRPRGAQARCNDGEYWMNATLSGACSSHGGVYKSYKTAAKAAAKAEKREMKADMKMEKKKP
jgi:hypothetical protein